MVRRNPERLLKPGFFKPDYRRSILNLASTLVKGLGGKSLYSSLQELRPSQISRASKVVLVVIDGLGYEWLLHNGKGSFLYQHVAARITSVFPSTTAAAMTTLYTGEPPGRHGLTGWFMLFRELGMIIAPLIPETRSGGLLVPQANPEDLLFTTPIFEKVKARSSQVVPHSFIKTPYNSFISRRSVLFPYASFNGWLRQTLRAARSARKFIFSYWPGFDSAFHNEGGRSRNLLQHFRAIDLGLARLAKALPKGTLMIVTADHGLVDRLRVIDVGKHPKLRDCLALPLTGERRMAYAYIKPGEEEQFKHYVTTRMRDACTLRKSSDLIREGWFGPRPSPELKYRVGDYSLIMNHGWIIRDEILFDVSSDLLGNHGGLSKEEMFVPLVAVKK